MAGLRRSDVAALRWADVEDADDGDGVLVTIRRSKTNVRYLKNGPARAVRALRAVATPPPEGRVVPLSPHRRRRFIPAQPGDHQMLVNLFCPYCAREAAQRKDPDFEVPVPIVRLRDDGVYPVRCGRGHNARVRLENLRFELLFEMGVYALHDGYTREAVSSCAAALERFYEFYVAVAAEAFNVAPEELAVSWKAVSRQSERQLGMFVAAHLMLTGRAPELLNPNRDVWFRNCVVHQGYVPEHHEAEEFCEVVLGLLDRLIDDIRGRYPIPLNSIYKRFLPAELEEVPRADGEEEVVGSINILTVVDVLHPRDREDDVRAGGISDQLKRIAKMPRTRMRLFSKEQLKAERPDLAPWLDQENADDGS